MRRILLVVLALFLVAGCCMGHPVAESALKTAISVNKGHMADQELPDEAKLIAQDNYDFCWKILYNLTGEKMPDEVKVRIEESR
jgi:hypothetical protein